MIRAHSAQGCYQYWTLHQLYHWLAVLGFVCCHGLTRLPQRQRLKLRHASFFNIVWKWNWLHLNRHGHKSREHLAEAGFISEGRIGVPAEHHLLTCDWVQHYCMMMELLCCRSRQIERVSYGRAKGWRCSQTLLFFIFFFLVWSWRTTGDVNAHWKVKNGIQFTRLTESIICLDLSVQFCLQIMKSFHQICKQYRFCVERTKMFSVAI